MEDLVSYAVAVVVIFAAYKWLSKPAASQTPAAPELGFQPKRVTQDMVSQVQNMFPDVPYDNIQYDLLRTGSVALTCNKILEQGYLPAPPPAYFTLYPTQAPVTPRNANSTQPLPATTPTRHQPTLIERYGLSDTIQNGATTDSLGDSKGKGVGWETTAEKREASLKEKKAKMILAARQKLLQKEKQAATS
ncbi:hypothetical protein FRB99_008369 [Tulasnella sp. 403]|nr:hypothetical protein FRB99_008369 [Tulasnella sp. 403]